MFPYYEYSLNTGTVNIDIKTASLFLYDTDSRDVFNRMLDGLKLLEDRKKGAITNYIESLFTELPNTLKASRILPYGTYILNESFSTKFLVYLSVTGALDSLSDTNAVDRVTIESVKNLTKGDKLNCSVTAFDYDTIIHDFEESSDKLATYLTFNSCEGVLKRRIPPYLYDFLLESLDIKRVTKSFNDLLYEAIYSRTSPVAMNSINSLNTTDIYSKEDKDTNSDKMSDSFKRKVDFKTNVRYNLMDSLIKGYSKKHLNDDSGIDVNSLVSHSYRVDASDSNELINLIETILRSDQTKQKGVPCLCGLSGVAKSAVVKQIADNNGWRMVDFRAAFLHRLDMEGMFYFKGEASSLMSAEETDRFNKFVANAYLGDFVQCSDQYIEVCKKMSSRLKKLKAETDKNSTLYAIKEAMIEDKTYSEIDKMIERFDYYSRPCVLFFDEILRAKIKILNLFTTLLVSKRFETLTFYNTKIVAAANTPHGMYNLEDGVEMFVSQEITDGAVFDRLRLIMVTPTIAFPGWLSWAKKQNWHPIILEFIGEKVERAYDTKFLDSKKYDVDFKRNSSYATFRAWEMVGRLFEGYKKTKSIDKNSVLGLLGPNTQLAKDFVDFCLKQGIVFTTVSPITKTNYDFASLLENNYIANVPTGLFSAAGMAKTVSVEKLARDNGDELLSFQMSQQTNSDLMGVPYIIDSSDFILDNAFGTSILRENKLLHNLLAEEVKRVEGIPQKVTKRAPKVDLYEKLINIKRYNNAVRESFKSAKERGENPPDVKLKKVILFFDECNRVPAGNESVMSAIFSAVSDYEFGGIKFDPDEVFVVTAANLNYEDFTEMEPDSTDEALVNIFGDKPSYGGTSNVDSALRLRFSCLDKPKATAKDAQETREWAVERSDLHPILKNLFTKLSDEEILKMIRSTEYKSALYNVPSMRSVSSLSGIFDDNPDLLDKGFFFPTVDSFSSHMLSYSALSKSSELERVNYIINILKTPARDNWCGLTVEKLSFEYGKVTTAKQLMELVDELVSVKDLNLDKAKHLLPVYENVIQLINRLEASLRNQVSNIVTAYLGDNVFGINDKVIQEIQAYTSNGSTFESIKDLKTAKAYITAVVGLEPDTKLLYLNHIRLAFNFLLREGRFKQVLYLMHAIAEMLQNTKSVYMFNMLYSSSVIVPFKDEYTMEDNDYFIDIINKYSIRFSHYTEIIDIYNKMKGVS